MDKPTDKPKNNKDKQTNDKTNNKQEKAPKKTENNVDKQEESSEISDDISNDSPSDSTSNINVILDIPLQITVELGRTKMLINDLLKLGQGSVIELTKIAGETLEIFANQRLIARGEVVVIKEKYGIRLTEIISPVERIEKLK